MKQRVGNTLLCALYILYGVLAATRQRGWKEKSWETEEFYIGSIDRKSCKTSVDRMCEDRWPKIDEIMGLWVEGYEKDENRKRILRLIQALNWPDPRKKKKKSFVPNVHHLDHLTLSWSNSIKFTSSLGLHLVQRFTADAVRLILIPSEPEFISTLYIERVFLTKSFGQNMILF